MERLTKTFTKSLVQWVWLSLGLSLFVFGFFLVKWNDPLTATDGETLTATKWNSLVDKMNTIETTAGGYDYDSGRFDVWTTSAWYGWATAVSIRNVYTKTHNLNSRNLNVEVYYRTSNTSTSSYKAWLYGLFNDGVRYCYWPYVDYADNNSIKVSVRYTWCNHHYVSPYVFVKTTWQYRLLVKKLP